MAFLIFLSMIRSSSSRAVKATGENSQNIRGHRKPFLKTMKRWYRLMFCRKHGENAAKEQPEGMKEITQLERRLKEALEKEDYETAAACRDQIRALKAGKGGEVHE